jgi:hypothetical protein
MEAIVMEKNLEIIAIIFALGLMLGLFLGSLSVYVFTPGQSRSDIALQVKDLYELSTGKSIDKVDVIRDGWLYKATIYIVGMDPTTIYLSLDGRIIAENTIDAIEYKASLDRQKSFIDCLYSKGLKIYLSDSNESLSQMQVFGGGRLPTRLSIDCVVNMCGIASYPSIIYNNQTYAGVKQLAWFESTTGCKF